MIVVGIGIGVVVDDFTGVIVNGIRGVVVNSVMVMVLVDIVVLVLAGEGNGWVGGQMCSQMRLGFIGKKTKSLKGFIIRE